VVDNLLGEFLRARRELVLPTERGLPDSGRRRVPGLRREEVATLAGISPEYYVRLERGRDRHPSGSVIAALAGALGLDDDSAAYLTTLAAPDPRPPGRPAPRDAVGPEVRRLLDAMPGVPAVVLGPFLDVLAHNALAAAMHRGPVPANLVRHVFLDPAARGTYPDWAEVAADTVGALRAAAVDYADDRRLGALVGELSLKSPEFARLWARHAVRPKTGGRKRMDCAAGRITVAWQTLAVAGAPGQVIVTYFGADAAAEAALTVLATSAVNASAV
jgi:transcriptional regulator with XRE-family HTH domain